MAAQGWGVGRKRGAREGRGVRESKGGQEEKRVSVRLGSP